MPAFSMLKSSRFSYFRFYGDDRFRPGRRTQSRMNFQAAQVGGVGQHDLGTSHFLHLSAICYRIHVFTDGVRTKALIVPHLLPSEGPWGRMRYDPIAAATMNVSA